MEGSDLKKVYLDFTGIYESTASPEDVYLDLKDIRGTDMYCSPEAAQEIRARIAGPGPRGIHFLDSGNYHYVSALFAEDITEDFALVLIDHHTDMQKPMAEDLLSCGGWAAHLADSCERLKQVLLIGPPAASMPEIDLARTEKLLTVSEEEVLSGKWRECAAQLRRDLPVYISIDRDALDPAYARSNWDQGRLTPHEVAEVLEMLLEDRKLIGADLCGELSDGSVSEYERQAARQLNAAADQEWMPVLEGERHATADTVMDLALQAGHILLASGAEIFRVEETMERICSHYGVRSEHVFVLSNGIFFTGGGEREHVFAKVEHIPVSGIHMDRITAVNQISRDIEKGKYTLDEAAAQLEKVRSMPEKRRILRVLAAGAGSAGFCYMFGGDIRDSICAFAAGFVMYLFMLYIAEKHFSKIVSYIFGAAIVTFLCTAAVKLGLACHMNFMVIGSIMPLIPGVAFTNAIRDIADGDYISGAVRMLDAMLVFVCIAIGAGISMALMQ